jgi:hypothetical protein
VDNLCFDSAMPNVALPSPIGSSLEWTESRRFLSRVISPRMRAGVRAGLVAAAATAGAIIGFGIRHGDWSGPFASLGFQVLYGFGVTDPPRFLNSAAGVAAHVAWMVLWGIAFSAMSHKATPARAVLVAIVVGTAAALIARSLLPAAMGAVKFAAMPGTQAVLCVVLMTAGLVTGRALSRAD